jgi:hypothetical protein
VLEGGSHIHSNTGFYNFRSFGVLRVVWKLLQTGKKLLGLFLFLSKEEVILKELLFFFNFEINI